MTTLDERVREYHQQRISRLIKRILMVSIIVGSCITFKELHLRIKQYQARKLHTTLTSEHTQWSAQWSSLQQTSKKLKRATQKYKLLTGTSLKEVLDAVSSSMPDMTLLHELSYEKIQGITLQGSAADAQELATFMLTLACKNMNPVVQESLHNGQGVAFIITV